MSDAAAASDAAAGRQAWPSSIDTPPHPAAFSRAAMLLILLWMAVEGVLLGSAFRAFGVAEDPGAETAHVATMAMAAAALPAALVLSLVWLLCAPVGGRWATGMLGLLAVATWMALDQIAAAAADEPVWLSFQPLWRFELAVTPAPLLLAWWLWGCAVAVFFYRYFWRGQVSRDRVDDADALRLSRLLVVTMLVSLTAAASRFWMSMLPIEQPEVLLATACVFGLGVVGGVCVLCVTVALLRSAWWGYGGLFVALLAAAFYVGAIQSAFGRTITHEWAAALLVALVATLLHYAIFLLPLKAAGYRLHGGR